MHTHFSLFPTDIGVLHYTPYKWLCTHICTHMHITVFYRYGDASQNPHIGGFTEPLNIGGFAKHLGDSYTHMHIFLQIWGCFTKAPYRGLHEAPIPRSLYTNAHFSLFPIDKGVLHKALIQRGLTKAQNRRGIAKLPGSSQNTHTHI